MHAFHPSTKEEEARSEVQEYSRTHKILSYENISGAGGGETSISSSLWQHLLSLGVTVLTGVATDLTATGQGGHTRTYGSHPHTGTLQMQSVQVRLPRARAPASNGRCP